MRNVAIVNVCNWGSTGKLAIGLYNSLKNEGLKPLFCYGRGDKSKDAGYYQFGTKIEIWWHYLMAHLTGLEGCFSKMATKRMLYQLDRHHIDTIFIFNLRGYFINQKLLFTYAAKHSVKVVYVMVDEFPYLGICGYKEGCNLYKNDCSKCPKGRFNKLWYFFSPGKRLFQIKKEGYDSIKNIVFVGPKYVIDCAKDIPMMKGREFRILDEAIDVCRFKPQDNTELRRQLAIKPEQVAVVCVAPVRFPTKGTRYFLEVARRFELDNRFVFVQVGYEDGYLDNLPSNYIKVGFLRDQDELSKYYSLADLFVFPSYQDTMPNACLEALASGSPLLCFDIEGMPYIGDSTVASFVKPHSVNEMCNVIANSCPKSQKQINICREYALKRYDNREYGKKLIEIGNK